MKGFQKLKICVLLNILSSIVVFNGYAQCPGAQGDQVTYGVDQWLGYVYSERESFNNADYQGFIIQAESFDNSFCGDDCNFATNGCDVQTETFTVRYKMQKDYGAASVYRITVGGDDGVRLSLDGGSTYVLGSWALHSYTEYQDLIVLNGATNMVFDYFENGAQNRVRMNITNLGAAWGGLVGTSQYYCQAGPVDPAAFTNQERAAFVSGGTPQYQWQVSTDNASWADISGATAATYDAPSLNSGIVYYRRRAFDGGSAYAYSNTLTVEVESVAAEDQTAYGDQEWIGYLYDNRDDFTNNYRGSITEPEIFDENFGGDGVNFSTSGCDVYTETYSARFRMRKTFDCGDYQFTIGADDGVRLSIDGGATFLINNLYYDHGYITTTSADVSLDGSYDLVLEYYENGGGNRVTFSYTQTNTCPLPVELSSFDVEAVGDVNELNWVTVSEINNAGFQVERSRDAVTYETIGWVEGNGNSNEVHSYSFEDAHAYGKYYYRLKQVDYDGAFEYSPVKVVSNQLQNLVEVYPNPANEFVIVKTPDIEFDYKVFNSVTGVEVNVARKGNRLLFENIKPGMYVLSITTEAASFKENIVIIH